MILPPRRPTLGIVLTAMLIGACSAAAPSTSPSGSPSAPPATTASPSASTSPSPTPTASPTATPTAAPTASPTAAAACKIKPVTGPLPSDRLVNVTASTTADADVLTFHFGNMSVPGPGGPPRRELSKAKKPYTFGPSGKPIKMQGEHVAQVVFRGLSLQSDTGDLVYTGPAKLTPDFPALKHAVEYDESEGVIGWYVGYDGTGCATLSRHGDDVMLTIAHS
jgi:hypothetical protein